MRRRTVLVGLSVVASVIVLVAAWTYRICLQDAGPIRPYPLFPIREDLAGPLVFISDTQEPLWLETRRLEEDDNVEATRRLFATIEKLDPLQAVFHLGDVTAIGSSGRAWQRIDVLLEGFRSRRIPFFPIMGNHDYAIWPRRGLANFSHRFGYGRPTGYLVRAGRVAVIMLNSNLDRLEIDEREAQERWYREQLEDLDRDERIEWILVACHHAPYTNSTIVDPDREVQRAFVAPFLAARKTALFLAGHAHAYEHFVIAGKDFVVCGGGGGLLHPRLGRAQMRWPDRIVGPCGRRYFHFVACRSAPGRLDVSIRELATHGIGSRRVYGFVLER